MQLLRKRNSVTPLGDTGYNSRHTRRNNTRVRAVLRHCDPGKYALDIGCNAGYFSQGLLESGLAEEVDAIEYDGSIVATSLKSNPNFRLFEGDATEFELERTYHTVIYGAVHHHIFAHHGFAKAMEFWQNIVSHTENAIFIESGQLAEGCRWYWQRALRRYYTSDEDYFADLMVSIGSRLGGVKLVGRHWIHGVPRWLFKIQLREPQPLVANEHLNVSVTGCFRRTIGSRSQKLVPVEAADSTHNQGVLFRTGTLADGRKVFCKQYISSEKELQEFCIAKQVDDPRFVKPIGVSKDVGIVYPFVPLETLASLSREEIPDRKRLMRSALALHRLAREVVVDTNYGHSPERRLIDVIDMHSANVFFRPSGSELILFDLELYSLSNKSRNRLHLVKIIYGWGPRDIGSILLILRLLFSSGIGICSFVFRSPTQRISERSVSIVGYLYTRLREFVDRLAIAVFPRLKQ